MWICVYIILIKLLIDTCLKKETHSIQIKMRGMASFFRISIYKLLKWWYNGLPNKFYATLQGMQKGRMRFYRKIKTHSLAKCSILKFVWRQLELAFFGAVTSVAALFGFWRKRWSIFPIWTRSTNQRTANSAQRFGTSIWIFLTQVLFLWSEKAEAESPHFWISSEVLITSPAAAS